MIKFNQIKYTHGPIFPYVNRSGMWFWRLSVGGVLPSPRFSRRNRLHLHFCRGLKRFWLAIELVLLCRPGNPECQSHDCKVVWGCEYWSGPLLSCGDTSGFTSVIKINKYLNQEIASSLHVLSALVAALIVSMDCIRQIGIVLGIAVLSCALADKSQVSNLL